ncbi:Uncharacterised protein [Legionella lansingensis]|uniref:Uncharacterized protein n=1 Tax=Legionella lansingensis TaxID=45067 RepID=A0A0W0VU30_9GAMM|nr:hypothetical protein [Legionella lansingensis]KTD23538.1 hypothetical protein Llan_0796 [Legionella lansingensis]SNV52016.1 Uncharacterised protein [Legionella lansingensis]
MLRLVIAVFAVVVSFNLWANDTELKLYRPFGETTQQAPVVIQKEVAGQCWQQSQLLKREDAWRCTAEGKTHDPCFVRKFGSNKEAICPQSPWTGDSIKINLISAVDNNQNVELNMAEAYPWAMELTTGEKCQAIDEGGTYDGLPIHYQCDSQTVLLGQLQRCKTEWSILQKNPRGVSTVMVARAWF